ncbi:MAG: glycosyltransferase family 2 protein [Nitrosotalea sp.]
MSSNRNSVNYPKVSIGMPVYNGERFICKRLESLLSQTWTNFELIISDNCSTDKTSTICKEYEKNDERIRYFRQEKNMGPLYNFIFVLQQAKYDYFAWAAVDDIWHNQFLEKNIKVLESDKNIIGSIGKVEAYGTNLKQKSNTIPLLVKKSIRKILFPQQPKGIFSISGSFEKKVRFYLKNSSCSIIYGIHRTTNLRKSMITDLFLGNDWAINLNLLKNGNFHVVDENLMFKFAQGFSSIDSVSLAMKMNKGRLGSFFPWLPFTSWCSRNLGLGIFLKNIDYFFLLNYMGLSSHVTRNYLSFKYKILRKVP